MKEGYKKTELGVLPNEWMVVELNELIKDGFVYEILDGNHGALYPRNDEFIEAGVPYISANSICRNKIDFLKAKFLSKERADKFRKGVAKEGDVLFAHNATVGPVALLETTEDKVILSTSLTYYRVNEKKIHNKYLMYFMSSNLFSNQYEKRMGQTTRNQVPITVQKELMHVIPTLEEQQRITQILSTVDSQIDDTDKLIQKTKELKNGLMQRLLNKGIGHKEFKKTEIGEIPIEWEVKRLLDVSLTKGEYGIGAAATDYIEGNPRYLRITDIGEDSRLLNSEIKGFEESNYNDFILKDGDIVFARTGNTTGKSYVYNPNDGELVYAGFLIRFRSNKDLICANFIKYIIQDKRYWDWVKVMSTRSGQPGINSGEYGEFKIQLPSIEEQEQIAKIISAVDAEIEEYENKKIKFEELKKGLMQQLLIGKIRV